MDAPRFTPGNGRANTVLKETDTMTTTPTDSRIDAVPERTLYRPRVYSDYHRRMVPLQGDKALQTTPARAHDYARQWLWEPTL